ncbi:hypothetical protein ASE85_14615 [Sphingobium sp. Leaf26]|uniref:hypothetical protein n=1 Tax=Sphingobium sp. Leaf26 TaxID=1735693 RepID=UPI0006FCB06D|nr:hypothetical protein [Sphingobium sp. Leaf26]KQM97507.1 hypothetical protein ASE85_14615 [Sphingobium sp. Leaf26]
MKISSAFAFALGLCAISAAAHAADPSPVADAATPVAKVGDLIFSADGRRVGRVDRIRGNSVAVIIEMKMIYIPFDKLSAGDRGVVSSLTLKEIKHL